MDLGQTAACLAREAGEIQRELDRHTQAQQTAFARLLAQTPTELQPLLRPLAPPQLVVTRHQVQCRLEHCVHRDVPLSFRIRPGSYGTSALAPLSDSKSVTITITVDRIPLMPRTPNQS